MSVAYTRESETVRRSAFVNATIECLAENGYHGTSVRKIAERAGVAPGLLTHYYDGKESLIAEAYRQLAERTFNHAADAAERAGDDPRLRFNAFVTASYFGPDMAFDLFKVWINFWALTITEPSVSAAHAETYGRYRQRLSELIEELLDHSGHTTDPAELNALAIGTNAVIDGLWLEYSLDPGTFDAMEAVRITLRFVGRSLGVDLEAAGLASMSSIKQLQSKTGNQQT